MTFPARPGLVARIFVTAMVVTMVACQPEPVPMPKVAPSPAPALAAGPDPEAVDEALRAALVDVRDRFKCNRISGCKAHDVLVGFGWRARPFLQQVIGAAPTRAPWRPRLVRILAELGDPVATPSFHNAMRDPTDEVRGYGIFGLHRVSDQTKREEIMRFAQRPGTFASSCARLTARWTLYAGGEAEFGPLFLDELRIRASQSLASVPVAWGLHLCTLPSSPDCRPVLALASRHPTFVVRRAVIDLLEMTPKRQDVPILLGLLADPIPSLGRRSRNVLVRLSGQPGLRGLAAWQNWYESTGATSD